MQEKLPEHLESERDVPKWIVVLSIMIMIGVLIFSRFYTLQINQKNKIEIIKKPQNIAAFLFNNYFNSTEFIIIGLSGLSFASVCTS